MEGFLLRSVKNI